MTIIRTPYVVLQERRMSSNKSSSNYTLKTTQPSGMGPRQRTTATLTKTFHHPYHEGMRIHTLNHRRRVQENLHLVLQHM
jgi:hypothetical protein